MSKTACEVFTPTKLDGKKCETCLLPRNKHKSTKYDPKSYGELADFILNGSKRKEKENEISNSKQTLC